MAKPCYNNVSMAKRGKSMKKFILIVLGALLLTGCGGSAAQDDYNIVASNVLIIKNETPVKVSSRNGYDTTYTDGVVMRVAELAYMDWDKSSISLSNTEVIKVPRRSIRITFYTDWYDIVGDGQVALPSIDKGEVVQKLDSGQTLNDSMNATVEIIPDTKQANARIIYEWFPQEIEEDLQPVQVTVPIVFMNGDGEATEITMDVALEGYPW